MNIIKRDGKIQEFNKDKIAEAIRKVFYAVGSQVGGVDKEIAKRIYDFYKNNKREAIVEDVQDMVEDDLLEMGFIKEAKAYIKYRQERTKVRQEGWKMDDLQFAIWNNKYRHNEESFDEWLARVSGGNSEVAKLIRDKKFLFGGRILANRGLQHKGKKVTFSNCFTPETEVLTETGYKPISTVAVGERVLTIDGTFQPVNAVLVNDFEGELITFEGSHLRNKIKSTPNHKFHTNEGWATSAYIHERKNNKKKTDLKFTSPTNLHYTGDEELDLLEFLKPEWTDDRRTIKQEGDQLHTSLVFTGGQGGIVDKKASYINRYITVDDEVKYLIGRYIGDGSITYRGDTPSIFQIVFSAKNERHAYDRIKNTIERVFGVTTTDNSNKQQGTLVLKVNNILFGQFMLQMAGRTTTKHLPSRYYGDISVLLGVLDSDGCVVNGSIRLVMKPNPIVHEISEWLDYNNIIHGVKEIKQSYGDGKHRAERISINKPHASKILSLLTKKYSDNRMSIDTDGACSANKVGKEFYSGKVYNLSVENNHNYVVEGISAHNCYVLPKPEDNLESIFNTARDMAKTYSMGGGVGISIGNLRPRGMPVNNTARTTSGAVSFMELYDLTTGLIGQAGRRGALMLSIPISHPDVEEFIDIKTEQGSVTKANISVQVTDEFMRSVINDTNYELRWEDSEGRKMTKTIRARELFNKNVKNNWDWAEAGFLFWDNINKHHIMSEYDDYEFAGTNPCVTGDTLVLTDKGNTPIVELVGKKTNIWNGFEWSEVVPSITGYNQDILSVKLSNGKVIDCTPYHEFELRDGRRVKAKDLTAGDKLSKFNLPVVEFGDDVEENVAYTQGFFSGDGVKVKNSSRARIYLYSDAKKKLLDKLYYDTARQDKTQGRIYVNVTNSMRGVEKNFVPTDYSVKSRLHWLAGLIDSDGAKNDSGGSVGITSIDKPFLDDVSNLLNTLGVSPTVALSKLGGKKMMPSSDRNVYKEYNTKDCYRLTISASDTRHLLDIGLKLHRVDISPNPNRNAQRFVMVDRVDYSHVADTVYCFTEPKNHTGVFNGVMTGQCGEVPLVAGGTCLLGSINLSEFVIDPFTDKAKVDFDGLSKAVRIAIRGLNEVLDEGEDLHPLQSQRDAVRDYRQIGLGVMGFADMLIKLGIKYGSYDCLSLIKTIGFIFSDSAISESSRIAVDKGSFKRYDTDKVLSSEYIKRATSDETKEEIRKNGLRNSQILAIAPTGTLSTLLGISGGAEPIFATKFKRKTESVHNEDVYYDVYTPIVKEAIGRVGVIPDYVVTSHDVSWQDRIAVQAYWQAFIDSAISSTVNLPNSATTEEVGELFKAAWGAGLKGVTIFRDGCKRAGILTLDEPDKEKEEEVEVEQVIDKYQVCSECGEKIEVIQNGCTICMNCGHSPC